MNSCISLDRASCLKGGCLNAVVRAVSSFCEWDQGPSRMTRRFSAQTLEYRLGNNVLFKISEPQVVIKISTRRGHCFLDESSKTLPGKLHSPNDMASPSVDPPVPAVPSQEFLAVQQLIDNDRSGDGSTVQKAVQTLTPDKQADFLKWYSGLATIIFQTENKKNAMAQPTSVDGFRTAIQAVNWTDTKSIDSYFSKLFGSRLRSASEPIYLGKDNGYRYYLRIKQMAVGTKRDLPTGTAEHPYVVQLQTLSGHAPPFTFAFPLGTLNYLGMDSDSTTIDFSKLGNTPFTVYLDVVKKGVWIVLQRRYQDELGESVDVPERANGWNYLPSPQNGRDLFQALQLLELKDLGETDENHSIFNISVMTMVFEGDLQPFSPAAAEVQKGLADSQRGGATG